MPIRIKNTADDRSKVHLHRVATKLIQEPTLLGRRLRLGDVMTISDEDYTKHKPFIDEHVRKGVFELLDPVPVTQVRGVPVVATFLDEAQDFPPFLVEPAIEVAAISQNITAAMGVPAELLGLPPIAIKEEVAVEPPAAEQIADKIMERLEEVSVTHSLLPPIAIPAVPIEPQAPVAADKKGPGKKKLI